MRRLLLPILARQLQLVLQLLLTLPVFLIVSCRQEDQEERAYDLAQSRSLLAVGDQLLTTEGSERTNAVAEDAAAAEGNLLSPSFLQSVENTREGRQLSAILKEQIAQGKLLEEANRLLAAERYNDLADLLDRAQREGLATSQLLELGGLPQALQALRLYCARRPYEHAADLEQNLDFLRPWARQLQTLSPTFQDFFQEQQQQLLEMRRQEAAAAEEDILRQLDWHLATAHLADQTSAYLAQAAESYPQLPILRLVQQSGDSWLPTAALHYQLAADQGFLARASSRDRLSLELAAVLSWKQLPPDDAQALENEWIKSDGPASLSGTFLHAKCLKDTATFETAIAVWLQRASREERHTDAPARLEDYLDARWNTQLPVATWDKPAPDFASVLDRFLEVTH